MFKPADAAMRFFWFWLAFGSLFLGVNGVMGQGDGASTNSARELTQLTFDELLQVDVNTVYGVSKYRQEISQAPASVTIITEDEIKKFGYRTLADALRSVPGVGVSYDRNFSYLGIRGLNRPGDFGSRSLVLVDGHRMNDNIYDGVGYGTDFPIDIDLIERIEVIRGPTSSVYGNNAVMGVINVVTKTGRHINGVESSVEGGSWDTYKGRFSIGQVLTNGIEFLFSGTYYQSAGQSLYFKEFNDPAHNYGVVPNSDGDRFGSLFTCLRYRDLTLEAAFIDRVKDVPTASYGTLFNSGLEKTTDQRGFLKLEYNRDLNEDIHLLGRVSYDRYEYHGAYPVLAQRGGLGSLVMNRDVAIGDWISTEFDVQHTVGEKLTLTEGIEFRQNLRQYQLNYDEFPRVDYVRDDRHISNLGVYCQADYAVLTNLTLNAGVRYDYQNNLENEASPRAGIIYSPWKKTNLKLLYGEAFRAPNPYELYYYASYFNKANSALEPEKIRTYEAVLEQKLPADVKLDLSGYYYKIDDIIEQVADPDGTAVFRNLSEAQAYGMEAGVEWRHDLGILTRVSYSLQRAEDTSTGLELSNSPQQMAKINLILPIYRDRLFTGLELLYTSGVHPFYSTKETIDPYWVANWTLFSQRIFKGVEFSASIYNLFDNRYGNSGGPEHLMRVIEQDGRSFRLKLTYRF